MEDFNGKILKVGDSVVSCVAHGRNAGATLVTGEVIGFTKCMVRLKTTTYSGIEDKNRLIMPTKVLLVEPKVYPVTDYHNWVHKGTPKEKRDKIYIGNIYVNAAECHECGWFIRSRNKHDFVTCKCGNVSVDGGSHYGKVNFKDKEKFTSIIEMFDDV